MDLPSLGYAVCDCSQGQIGVVLDLQLADAGPLVGSHVSQLIICWSTAKFVRDKFPIVSLLLKVSTRDIHA